MPYVQQNPFNPSTALRSGPSFTVSFSTDAISSKQLKTLNEIWAQGTVLYNDFPEINFRHHTSLVNTSQILIHVAGTTKNKMSVDYILQVTQLTSKIIHLN